MLAAASAAEPHDSAHSSCRHMLFSLALDKPITFMHQFCLILDALCIMWSCSWLHLLAFLALTVCVFQNLPKHFLVLKYMFWGPTLPE